MKRRLAFSLVVLALCVVWSPGTGAVPGHDAVISAPATPSSATAMQKAPPPPADNGDTIVYITKTGAKYHSAGCSSLRKSKIPIKLRDAVKNYGACKNCKPPLLTTTQK